MVGVHALLDGIGFQWNPLAAGPFGAALASALAFVFIAGKPGDRRVQRAFLLLAAIAAVWCASVGLIFCVRDAAAARFLSRLGVGAVILSGPGSLRFAGAMLRRPVGRLEHASRLWTLVAFAVAAATPLMIADVWAPPWGGLYPVAGPLFLPISGSLSLQFTVAGYQLLVEERRLEPSLRRLQLRWVLASILVGAFGSFDVLGGYQRPLFPPIGWACGLLSVGIVLYATAAHRLMDIRTVALRSVGWTAASLLILPLAWAAFRLEGRLGLDAPLPTAVLLVTLVVFARLYVAHARPWIDRLLDARRLALYDLVIAFAERALACRTPRALVELAAHTLADATRSTGAVLVALASDGRIEVYPEDSGAAPSPDDPGFRALFETPEPLTLDELESRGDAEVVVPGTALLSRFGASAVVPLVRQGERLGLLFVRPPRGRRLFQPHEVRFLGDLGHEAAVALVNARLFGELERRAKGLEAQVERRTAEIARTLEDLKHAQVRLVHAERMASLGLLVAGVSHEINNALNFIYGNLGTLRKYLATLGESLTLRSRGAARPATTERALAALPAMVDELEDRARRVRRTVEHLRRFARHDESERKRANLHDGLEATLQLLGPTLGDRVALERRFGDLPEIECSPGALNQVWMALLINAAQAIPEAGRIEVRSRLEGEDVVVEVEDSGAGMAEEVRARAFDPFFTTRPAEGSGLGLTVARSVVERHGGAIELERAAAGGTLARVRLPLRPPTTSAVAFPIERRVV